jgi:site-specific DNA recombinase
MSEESRLGREQIQTAYALKQIMDADVRVFFYLEDRERTLGSAMDKMMLSLTNFGAEFEREKAGQRTYDAMLRKAKAGHVTGGRVYGYDNVDVLGPPGADGQARRAHVIRKVNDAQATIIRRIFELSTQGLGLTRIAKTLNADRIPPPRKAGLGWAPTAVREILHRPLYRGEVVWNKLQKVDRGGTKKRRRRPPEDWLRLNAPDLRIVPQELWESAHTRLKQSQANFGQVAGPRRPSRLDRESPYLLSGLGRCGVCGGALIAMTRGHGAQRGRYYGCGYHHKRGPTVCTNSLQIKQEHLDHALLDAIAELLDAPLVDAAVERVLARLPNDQAGRLDRRTTVEQEIAKTEATEQRLVDAVARGEGVEPLLARLKAEGERKRALERERAALDQRARVTPLDARRLKQELKARAKDIRGVLGRHVPQTRHILRQLLVDRLECTPVIEGGRRGYRFSGEGTFGRLLTGEGSTTKIGVPDGTRQQRDSRARLPPTPCLR